MYLTMLSSKIHRATVTEANLNYIGSITIDSEILEKANILEYEKVQVVNINNGERFETYAIKGEKGSKVICLNGAAARCAQVNDKIIIMSYAALTPDEAKTHIPNVVFVNENNSIDKVTNHERCSELF